MILDATTRSLEVVLAGAVTTNQLNVTSEWVDMTASATTGGATTANTNSTTAVTIVAAPAASTQRRILGVSIYNADTATATVTVRTNDNSTMYPAIKIAVPSGYTLQYTDTAGWYMLDLTASKTGPVGPTGATGSTGLSGINAQTGTTYTLVLADANKLVTCDNASAITVTIPPNSSVAFPIGTPVYFSQKGAGKVTVAGDTGVTLTNASTAKTRAQRSLIGIVQTATDAWLLYGDME